MKKISDFFSAWQSNNFPVNKPVLIFLNECINLVPAPIFHKKHCIYVLCEHVLVWICMLRFYTPQVVCAYLRCRSYSFSMEGGFSTKPEPVSYFAENKSTFEMKSIEVVGSGGLYSNPDVNGGKNVYEVEAQMEPDAETTTSSLKEKTRNCCVANLDTCCGNNVRGVRSCCVCLKRASKEVAVGCRHLKCKDWAKDTFTVDNARKKFPVSIWLPKYRSAR